MEAIDLFAGVGGISKGWIDAGHRVIAAVERDPYCAETYSLNHREVKVFGGWLAGDLSRDDVLEGLDKFEGVDCVLGGPPCQAFSTMGRADPADVRAKLVER